MQSAALEKILIVDDEPDAIENCRRMLSKQRYQCLGEADPQRALAVIERERPRVLLTDLRMPGLDGIALLQAARRIDPAIKVVLLTAYASLQTAVASMRHGAFDYLAKPFTGKELFEVIRRALGQDSAGAGEVSIAMPVSAVQGGASGAVEPVLAGCSAAIQSVRIVIERIAETEAAVLLTGERGTGKARIARAIHARSLRHSGPFLSVDCQSSGESLLEWELFGSQLSAGAGIIRVSALESAAAGTLFLDEVSALSLRLQAKLLRALKERRMRRMNGDTYRQVDVRVVAASSKNLQQACGTGEFRTDLLQFLNVVPIVVPPLRERVDDLELLAQRLLEPVWRAKSRRFPDPFCFSPAALAALRRHPWPGNVQELQRVVERAAVLTDGPQIAVDCLPDELRVR